MESLGIFEEFTCHKPLRKSVKNFLFKELSLMQDVRIALKTLTKREVQTFVESFWTYC